MAGVNGGTGDREAGPVARRFTKLSMLSIYSILENLTFRLNIRSNQASTPPVPPPLLPQRATASSTNNQILTLQDTGLPATSISPLTPNRDLHPIIETMREHELGKVVMNLAVPAATALLLSSNGNSQLLAHIIVVGLMTGYMAVWNGILLRKIFPHLANVVEQFGISLVLLFLYGLIASFLPKGFSWVCWLYGGLSLVPFIISLVSYVKQPLKHLQHMDYTSGSI